MTEQYHLPVRFVSSARDTFVSGSEHVCLGLWDRSLGTWFWDRECLLVTWHGQGAGVLTCAPRVDADVSITNYLPVS